MAAERRLDVWWDEILVGQFVELASNLARFEYSSDYNGRPISVSMPVRGEGHEGRVPYDFLTNLLPEIDRDRLARQHRLDRQDTFGLLGVLGRECAGALRIVPEGEKPDLPPPEYEALTQVALDNWLQTRATQPLLTDPQGRIRLSLAGAQAKAALFFDADDQAFLPLNGAITTHIVKPAMPGQQPSTAHVELFCMRLAQRVLGSGDVPECDLWNNLFRIRRYDRPGIDGELVRIHQEDFCQALGESVHSKYEDPVHPPEPPYLARCMRLLDTLGDQDLVRSPALERNRLLQRVLFNVLIHNADAHLKNYSLLYERDGGLRIAPLYDAVCTAGIRIMEGERGAYTTDAPRQVAISTDMGMRIGREFDMRRVGRKDWSRMAKDCGITPRFVHKSRLDLCGKVQALIDDVADAVRTDYPATENAVGQTLPLIREQVERLSTQ